MATAAFAAVQTPPVFPQQSAIRILTVDEHPLVREGLSALLAHVEGMAVIAQAGSASEGIAACRRYKPDVVTLDLLLPDMPGEEAARQMLVESPGTRVVVITAARGDVRVLRALEAGVHGFVLKGMGRQELIETIRCVHNGRKRIPNQVAMMLAEHVGDESLTPREVEVLGLVAQGNRNKQVAAQLAIAEETVRMHMKNILGKLSANDRTHAVTIALSRGILAL